MTSYFWITSSNLLNVVQNPIVHVFQKINHSKFKILSLAAWSPKLGNEKSIFIKILIQWRH